MKYIAIRWIVIYYFNIQNFVTFDVMFWPFIFFHIMHCNMLSHNIFEINILSCNMWYLTIWKGRLVSFFKVCISVFTKFLIQEREIVQTSQSEGNIDRAVWQHYLLVQGEIVVVMLQWDYLHSFGFQLPHREKLFWWQALFLLFAFGSKGYWLGWR